MESELTDIAEGTSFIGTASIGTALIGTAEYRPSNYEVLRDYEIVIKFISRGCIVRVGCKEIPFESIENGMKAINDYVTNPYEERMKWEEILK